MDNELIDGHAACNPKGLHKRVATLLWQGMVVDNEDPKLLL